MSTPPSTVASVPWLALLGAFSLGCAARRPPPEPAVEPEAEPPAVDAGWVDAGGTSHSPLGATLRVAAWDGRPPLPDDDPLARLDQGPYVGGPDGLWDGPVWMRTAPDGDGLRVTVWGSLRGAPVRVDAWLPDVRFEDAWVELMQSLATAGAER